MNASTKNLENAFRLAHYASEEGEFGPAAKALFRAIAHQIWLAAGATPDWREEALKRKGDEGLPASGR